MQYVVQLSFDFNAPIDKPTIKFKTSDQIVKKLSRLDTALHKMSERERQFFTSIKSWHDKFFHVSDRQDFVLDNLSSRYLAS